MYLRRIGPLILAALAVGMAAGCANDKPKQKNSGRPTAAVSPALSVGGRTSSADSSVGPSPVAEVQGRLNCLTGVKTYRYSGQMALNLSAAASAGQLGGLSNLLKDVKFDGAFQAPDASTLNVSFPGAAGSQDLQTAKVGGKFYQRTGQDAWQQSAGAGPIVGTLSQLDPQTLCNETIAQVDASGITPVEETVNGVKARHYSFGPADLARSPGILGSGGGERGGSGQSGGNQAPQDTHLDVWTSQQNGYPVRIVLRSTFSDAGGNSSLSVSLDLSDFNGADIAIQAPR